MTEITEHLDVPYAAVEGQSLSLDVYASGEPGAPTVLYVHGGAFQRGDKRQGADTRLRPLARRGLSVVSVDYRLAPAATFPDPIHDLKAAIRFVRARGDGLGLRTARIGALGASAGGYLAAMAAFTPGVERFEGTLGEHRDQSSAIQAASLWFTPVDLRATARRSPLEQEIFPVGFERALLGVDDMAAAGERAAEASPLTWVTGEVPPLLLEHGDSDRVVPFGESRTLQEAVVRVGGSCTMAVLGGAGHEDPRFDSAANLDLVAAWLRSQLTTGAPAQ